MFGSMAHSRARRNPADGRALVQRTAALFGVVFLVIGVLGFVPGVTTRYGELSVAGHGSRALLFGAFQVSVLHNIVHLLFGVAGVALARGVPGARRFLFGGGAIYLALWLYGLIIGHRAALNVIPVNTPDNWLHAGLGVAMITLGLVTGRR